METGNYGKASVVLGISKRYQGGIQELPLARDSQEDEGQCVRQVP